MNATLLLPNDMPTIGKLIGAAPSFSVQMIHPEELAPPQALFDPAVPVGPASALDTLVPLVAFAQGNGFELVDGCKRLARVRSLRQPVAVALLDLPLPKDICARQAGLLRLALNRSRPLHLREKVRFGIWMHLNIEDPARTKAARELGLSDREMRCISNLAGAQPQAAEAVASGRIALELAADFLRLSLEDQRCVLQAFEDLAPSFQTQRELLEWLPEIAVEEKTTLDKLLQRPEIHGPLANTALNAPQRIAALRQAVFALRFGRYNAAHRKWQALADRVNPDPRKVRFTPAPFFERDTLEISVSISSGKDGQRIFGSLAHISAESWQSLVCPIE